MRQLRQGGLAKVGGFGQQLPNDSTWTVRTQSPTFHHEACKSLATQCAQSRRRRCTEEAREDITSCVWCDHTSAETTHEEQAGNVPKGEAAVWKGEIFLLVFIFQTFYSEQSDSKNGPCIEGTPGSQPRAQPRAQHLLLYLTPNPLLSAASPRTQMSAYPVTAESPASAHPGTQQTRSKMCAREKKRSPHFTAKGAEAQEPPAQGHRAGKWWPGHKSGRATSQQRVSTTHSRGKSHPQSKSPVKSTRHSA